MRGLTGPPAVRAYRAALAVGDAEPLAEDRYTAWAAPTWMRSSRHASPPGSGRSSWPWRAGNRLRLSSGPGRRIAPNRCGRWRRWRWSARSPRPAIRLPRCRPRGVPPTAGRGARRGPLTGGSGARAAAAALRGGAGAGITGAQQLRGAPFVGREAELASIRRRLDRGSGPSVVAVAGPSGTGKSRLLAEVARTDPAITVQAFWADRDEPWALGRALLGELAAADFTTVGALPDQLRTALATVLPDLAPGGAPLDPASRQALVLEAGVRLAAALDRPLLMVDDLQWADPTSLRLLAALHDRVPGLRLLLACRSDEVPPDGAVGRVPPTDGRRAVGRSGPADAVGHRSADAGARARGGTRAAHRSVPPCADRSRSRAGRHRRDRCWTGRAGGRWRPRRSALAVADLGARSQRRAISARAGRFSGSSAIAARPAGPARP